MRVTAPFKITSVFRKHVLTEVLRAALFQATERAAIEVVPVNATDVSLTALKTVGIIFAGRYCLAMETHLARSSMLLLSDDVREAI